MFNISTQKYRAFLEISVLERERYWPDSQIASTDSVLVARMLAAREIEIESNALVKRDGSKITNDRESRR